MPLELIRNDITKMQVDAIVNAANNSLLGGGGVDGAIHRTAGHGLLQECKTLGDCATGDAKITKGYRLPAKYVIHTVGPIWNGGRNGEKELLISCYRRSLEVAADNACESVAFPLISAGIYRYPRADAIRVAVDTISDFLTTHDMTVYLVIFDTDSFEISSKLFSDIKQFIDDNYAAEHDDCKYRSSRLENERRTLRSCGKAPVPPLKQMVAADMYMDAEESCDTAQTLFRSSAPSSLEDALCNLDESFSQMLLRKIDEKGITDAQCYKKANIDRKLFSKIRGDIHYRPSKPTVLAFAIALELPLNETRDMLMKAGYALSRSSKSDIIVEYFIQQGNYNIFEINEALFAFDQSLLGA